MFHYYMSDNPIQNPSFLSKSNYQTATHTDLIQGKHLLNLMLDIYFQNRQEASGCQTNNCSILRPYITQHNTLQMKLNVTHRPLRVHLQSTQSILVQ